ncbi:MAG: carbohydrate kinase family protein [Candidatus Limnocylindrales bacterium]
MTKIQITCAGSAVFDVLAKAAGPLPIGVLGLVDKFSTAEGGPALRTGRVLAGMGIETRLVIPVGDDIFGRSFRETVPAPHLHVEFVESELPTSTSLVAVDQDGERTMLHNLGADGSITAEAIEARMESDFLHVGGALVLPGLDDPDGAPLAGLFERAKAKGIHTSLDVVHDSTGRWRRVLAALPYTDLFIPSVPEAEGITGVADPAAAAARLRGLGVRFAIVTDGPNGAWVDHDDFVGHVPAFKVDTIDTTGAGDSFTGGVLTALIHGFGAEDAARMGAALGALCTTTIDTFTGPADPADAWRMAGLEPPA